MMSSEQGQMLAVSRGWWILYFKDDCLCKKTTKKQNNPSIKKLYHRWMMIIITRQWLWGPAGVGGTEKQFKSPHTRHLRCRLFHPFKSRPTRFFLVPKWAWNPFCFLTNQSEECRKWIWSALALRSQESCGKKKGQGQGPLHLLSDTTKNRCKNQVTRINFQPRIWKEQTTPYPPSKIK